MLNVGKSKVQIGIGRAKTLAHPPDGGRGRPSAGEQKPPHAPSATYLLNLAGVKAILAKYR
jgi:hypothetical protein